MNDEPSFLQAMQDYPEDNALRLVFADWLEERGDSRGELVRLLHTLTQCVKVRGRKKLEDRLRSLLGSGVQPVGPFWTNSIGMKFAWIPAGTYLMGSPEGEEGRNEDEIQHKVLLTKGFYIAIHSVTQTSWRVVMGNDPSDCQDDAFPAQQVSWEDCEEFLEKLSERDGHAYRLPTEAEWEYACRAGTTTPFSFGEAHLTPWKGVWNGIEIIHQAPLFNPNLPPNGWGLYDMNGNVWEWCVDWYGDYPQGTVIDPQGQANGICRVFRGGSFWGEVVRSAFRNRSVPDYRSPHVGLRPVRVFP